MISMIYDFQRIFSLRLMLWGFLSVFSGLWLWFSGDLFWRGFGLQTATWGVVDAAIALYGLRGLAGKLAAAFDPLESARRTRWLRRILGLNAGLDVFYIAVCLALS